MFKDAASAIKFAERYAAKSNIKSQMGNLLTNSFGGEEVWDIAMTISARVAQCTPQINGLALKCIYGLPVIERDEMLGEMIGNYLIDNGLDSGKSPEQLRRLGLVTVLAERTIGVNKAKYPVKRMANEVGISREQFSRAKSWLQVRGEALQVLQSWLSSGNREMELWLEEQNWFVADYVNDAN